MDKCKFCGKEIHYNLRKCPHCDKPWPSKSASEDTSISSAASNERTANLIISVFFIAIAAAIYFIFIWDSPEDKREAKEEAKAAAIKKVEDKRRGFHCLSTWDGSHREVANHIKKQLRDPDSFEHIETRIGPKDEDGKHLLYMKYRAINGFGGKTVGGATASVANSGCSATIITSE